MAAFSKRKINCLHIRRELICFHRNNQFSLAKNLLNEYFAVLILRFAAFNLFTIFSVS